ncbi:MAG: TonB-dependent receptor [Pseudomonadota bacterium]
MRDVFGLKKYLLGGTCIGLCAVLGAGGALAQLDEVVVTARKRSENAQSVPVAISAYSAETLEETGFDGFDDLEGLAPGLQFGNFGPVTFVNLRGIGNENTTAGGDPGVALHYDGVYLGRPVAFLFTAFDSERVEILRGPQGTLYGRNATGGSINYITKKPTEEFEVEADFTVGNYNMYRGRAAVNIPIADGVSSRLVGFIEDRDGFTENPTGPNPNDAENWGLRGHLAFNPNDRLDVLVSATYIESGGVGTKPELREPFMGTTVSPPQTLGGPPGFAFSGGPASGIPGGNVFIDANGNVPVNDLRPFIESNSTDLSSDLEFLLISATIDYEFDAFSVKSISAYAESSFESLQDQDHSVLELADLLLTESSEQFSQELQILSNGGGPFNWILGGYFFYEEASRRSQFFQSRFDVFADVFGVPAGWDIDGDVTTTSFAFFGQGTYDITDALSFTGGVRYSNDEKDGENRGFIFAGAPYAAPVQDSWDEITYRLVLDYQVTDQVLAYGGFSTGYRSGGINQAVNPLTENAIYEPETVDAYEVGLKTNLFGNRAQINLSAYRNEYSDLQFQVFGATGPAAFNASGATVQGIELEVLATPTESSIINISGGYIDSEFDDQVVDGVDIGGNQVQRTPEWTFNIGGTQEFYLGDYGTLRVRGDYSYTDEIFYTALNRNAGFGDPGGSDLADSFSNVDARLIWNDVSDRYTVEFAVTNVFDTAQTGNLFRGIGFNDIPGGGGGENVTYNPPRQFMGRIGVSL